MNCGSPTASSHWSSRNPAQISRTRCSPPRSVPIKVETFRDTMHFPPALSIRYPSSHFLIVSTWIVIPAVPPEAFVRLGAC